LASFGGGAGNAKVAAEVGPRRRVATGAGRVPPFAAVSMTPEWRWCFCQMSVCAVSTSDICKAHTLASQCGYRDELIIYISVYIISLHNQLLRS
jgi:hypothetical protein